MKEWLGGCQCGDLRYRVTGEPWWVGHCHCLMCQKLSGAAFLTAAMFPKENFQWTRGTPSFYASSETAKRSFCARCSSSLTWESSTELALTAGCMDRSTDLEPTKHVWTSEMRTWIKLNNDLPSHQGEEPSEE